MNALSDCQTYRMHIPAGIPTALYWSVTAYDTGTRSQIRNGEEFSRITAGSAVSLLLIRACDPQGVPGQRKRAWAKSARTKPAGR